MHSLKGKSGSANTAFQENFNIAQEGLAKRFRIAPWQSLYNPSNFRRACAEVHRFVDDYIHDWNIRSKEEVQEGFSYGFIDELARHSSGPKAVRDQLLNILLAGRDTTACALSWTLYVCIEMNVQRYLLISIVAY